MQANPFRGLFSMALEMAGPKKSRFSVATPPNCPRNGEGVGGSGSKCFYFVYIIYYKSRAICKVHKMRLW
jgi:hypothetical protein